ncbi:MAG: hypothetical protein E5Y79_28390 [Mesorhizobium sp.]|uniref:hypothetical protein n=1 Tax=Mesorhizobium sp. TaxID=1871066 RepID=UPI0012002B72|nr:hypothetical protein [Mesorhizobium sp.]TIL56726.1 MAG: hypothetical protein E5Y79_28390 [Mesorhizobium sp.]
MATIANTAAASERHLGFPARRGRTIIRSLIDHEILSPGAPGVAVEIGAADFVSVLIALASGAKIKDAADTVAQYTHMTPSGIHRDTVPNAPMKTAFDYLVDAVFAALGDIEMQRKVAPLTFDFCETWPELAVHAPEGVTRFILVGSLARYWQSGRQRRSTTISGLALINAARDLFSTE